jgi:DNA polymerase-3 subunit delta
MHYRQAQERIRAGKVQPFYLFSGPEVYLKKDLLREILQHLEQKGKHFYLEKVDGATFNINNLIKGTKQVTIFSSGRLLWVDNPAFLMKKKATTKGKGRSGNKNEGKEIETFLQSKLENEIIILSVPEVDRRKKIVKMIESVNALIEFPLLKGNALLRWIKKEFSYGGKQVEDEALHELVQRVGEDLYLIKQEIEKIITYLSGEKKVTKPLIESLVPENRQVNIFNLVDAVGHKDSETTFLHLRNMLRRNEHPLIILAMVSRQYRLLYQVLFLQDKKMTLREIASFLKLPPFFVERLLEQAKGYSKNGLSRIMAYLKDTDLKIKTGFCRPEDALEQLLLQLTIADWT